MNNPAPSTAESSWLLWSLGVGVAWLAAYVALGWVRMAQRDPLLRKKWGAVVLASATLGTGLCAAVVLSLDAEALAFPLGYRAWAVPALWAGAVVGSLPVVVWPAFSRRWWALVGSGTLLALLAAAVQAGWILAAGFRPGVRWSDDIVTSAVVLMIIGCSGGVWTGLSGITQGSRHRLPWRLAAAALLGLSLMLGQELMTTGGGVLKQAGSIYVKEVSGTVLSLLCGVLLPMLLMVMAIDLALRRQRASPSDPSASPRRRRRHRHRVPGA